MGLWDSIKYNNIHHIVWKKLSCSSLNGMEHQKCYRGVQSTKKNDSMQNCKIEQPEKMAKLKAR